MEETYIDRMKIEKAELEQRITKLLAFIESDKFAELDATDKKLLRMQYCGMDTYLTALDTRLAYDGLKRYQAEVQEFCKRIPELEASGKTDKEIGDMMPQMKIDISKAYPSLLFNSLIAAKNEPTAAI